MLPTANTIARALVWLATLATAAQGLQVSICPCGDGTAPVAGRSVCSSSETGSSCCCSATREETCCGKGQSARDGSCCGAPRPVCRCGLNCQCGKVQQPAPAPSPPAEHTDTDKVTVHTISVDVLVHCWPPHAKERCSPRASPADAMAALDRCISLCRFVL